MSHILPPRKRDWTPGTYQVGSFLRTPNGSVIETAHDKPGPLLVELVRMTMLSGLTVDCAIEALQRLKS